MKTAADLLDELNPVQREAAAHVNGPMLILAGAGSGKTRVLTYRVAHLIQQGVAPHRILAVTFTNKAANEMKERIQRLCGESAQGCWLGTFHAICARILRQDAENLELSPNFVVFDDSDQLQIIRECLSELNIDQETFKPRAVLSLISRAKEELLTPQEYGKHAHGYTERTVARVYPLYQQKLRQNQALDFDDLICMTVRLLESDEEARQHWQKRFSHVLIDEYQDINYSQYMLVKLLAEKHRNLCVVGDDDQSVYGWRGADVRFILAFEDDYAEAKVLKLEQNYRSTQKILDAAFHVVKQNRGRRDKRLWTDNAAGDGLRYYHADDELDEARYVADAVEEAVGLGECEYGDFAVLYRTNAQSRVLEDVFRRRRVPYRIVGSVRFYDRKEVKDLIGYLRLISNPADSLSLRRVLNAPPRGIGAKSIERLEGHAARNTVSLFDALADAEMVESLTPRARAAIRQFVEMIQRMAAKPPETPVTEMVHLLIDESGYLKDLKEEKTLEAQARVENVQEMVNVTREYDENVGLGLRGFLEQMALMSDVDTYKEEADAITMMTVHAAKGLEFRHVFLVGMEEEIFPHGRSLTDQAQLEEERRLCYVGITRARQQLALTHSRRRTVFGQIRVQNPSRFLREIPEELFHDGHSPHAPYRYREADSTVFGRRSDEGGRTYGAQKIVRPQESGSSLRQVNVQELVDRHRRGAQGAFKPGDRVRHAAFGNGIVTKSTGTGADEQVSVVFPGVGEKKLIAGYAKLEKL